MKLFQIIGQLLLIYVIYKVIFDFVIPVYKTTKQVKTKMNDMNARMQEQQRKQAPTKPQEPEKKANVVAKDDYIDYEEVK